MAAKNSLSLHVSQLPFDLTKAKLARHLEAHGVNVSEAHGLRFCYEKGSGDFSGVAFVDVLDDKSYTCALKLHRQRFGGRLMNVRPTKSKDDLATIVAAREAKLLADGLRFKIASAGDSALTAADKLEKKRSREEESGKATNKKAKKPAAAREQKKKVESKPRGSGDLEGREKWSKSKRARMRAKQKKFGTTGESQNATSTEAERP
jgi:hypothetical protein